jgi:hypothetical protein
MNAQQSKGAHSKGRGHLPIREMPSHSPESPVDLSPWGTQCDLPSTVIAHCSVTGQRLGEIVPASDTGSFYTFRRYVTRFHYILLHRMLTWLRLGDSCNPIICLINALPTRPGAGLASTLARAGRERLPSPRKALVAWSLATPLPQYATATASYCDTRRKMGRKALIRNDERHELKRWCSERTYMSGHAASAHANAYQCLGAP